MGQKTTVRGSGKQRLFHREEEVLIPGMGATMTPRTMKGAVGTPMTGGGPTHTEVAEAGGPT